MKFQMKPDQVKHTQST